MSLHKLRDWLAVFAVACLAFFILFIVAGAPPAIAATAAITTAFVVCIAAKKAAEKNTVNRTVGLIKMLAYATQPRLALNTGMHLTADAVYHDRTQRRHGTNFTLDAGRAGVHRRVRRPEVDTAADGDQHWTPVQIC